VEQSGKAALLRGNLEGPWEIWSGALAGPSRVLTLELSGTNMEQEP